MPGGLYPPTSVRETWPAPDYIDPQLRGFNIVTLVAILGTSAFVVSFARFWSRFRLQGNVGIDDWLFFAAMPFTFAFAIGTCLMTIVYKCDRHIWDIQMDMIVPMRKIAFANCSLYIVSTCLIKLSILAFYRRLTDRAVSMAFIYIVWTFMAVECCQIVVCLATLCFSCYPMEAYWLQFIPSWTSKHSYSCIPQGPALLAMSIISVSQDLVATVLPFSLFLKMKISLRQKIALSCTFLGGLFVCAVGAYRCWTVYRMYWLTYDITWSAYDFEAASAAEVLLATIFASAPALKYYFRNYLDEHADKKNGVGSSADPFLATSTDGTRSYSTTNTRTNLSADDMDFWTALDPSGEKKKASFAALTPSWEDGMPDWRDRTPSAQELELRAEGIISPGGSFEYFDKKTKRMVVNEKHPVIYPWED